MHAGRGACSAVDSSSGGDSAVRLSPDRACSRRADPSLRKNGCGVRRERSSDGRMTQRDECWPNSQDVWTPCDLAKLVARSPAQHF